MPTCDHCDHLEIAYNSCRNRHCPKCQGAKQEQWVQARIQDLLPVPYHHVVFTLPDEPLHTLMLYNKSVMYDLFFQSAAETLHTFARDPEHLGAEIGFTGVLHTLRQAQGRPGGRRCATIRTCTSSSPVEVSRPMDGAGSP